MPISIHALREEGDVSFVKRFTHKKYFYPRPPRGGRPMAQTLKEIMQSISIHALREEGDAMQMMGMGAQLISIHALREEGDVPGWKSGDAASSYFYPRPPRGGRQSRSPATKPSRNFYPRPPRGGRRGTHLLDPMKAIVFLSTPSARRATIQQSRINPSQHISIHALREEGDVYNGDLRR